MHPCFKVLLISYNNNWLYEIDETYMLDIKRSYILRYNKIKIFEQDWCHGISGQTFSELGQVYNVVCFVNAK